VAILQRGSEPALGTLGSPLFLRFDSHRLRHFGYCGIQSTRLTSLWAEDRGTPRHFWSILAHVWDLDSYPHSHRPNGWFSINPYCAGCYRDFMTLFNMDGGVMWNFVWCGLKRTYLNRTLCPT
jgi:hypothetical protein